MASCAVSWPWRRFRRWLGPRRFVSLPFSYAAGPLAQDPATAVALSEAVLERARERGVRRIELKSRGEHPAPARLSASFPLRHI